VVDSQDFHTRPASRHGILLRQIANGYEARHDTPAAWDFSILIFCFADGEYRAVPSLARAGNNIAALRVR
jgi:hypothetical protein